MTIQVKQQQMKPNIDTLTPGRTASETQTVLLVDDDSNFVHSLARSLHSEPYRIYTARSAEEAMDILKEEQVDLVVSDEKMPGMCGTMFVRWIAKTLPQVVCIILTGRPDFATARKALDETHLYRYFAKPCDLNELALAIRQALSK